MAKEEKRRKNQTHKGKEDFGIFSCLLPSGELERLELVYGLTCTRGKCLKTKIHVAV